MEGSVVQRNERVAGTSEWSRIMSFMLIMHGERFGVFGVVGAACASWRAPTRCVGDLPFVERINLLAGNADTRERAMDHATTETDTAGHFQKTRLLQACLELSFVIFVFLEEGKQTPPRTLH